MNIANPLAQILSVAMLFEYFDLKEEGALIRKAVDASLDENEMCIRDRSDDDAVFDKEVRFEAADIEPMITYGTNPGMGMGITQHLSLIHI